MANLSLIRHLCEERKITLKELAEAISISQNGLQRIIKDNSTRIDTLEKIADYLSVPITDFFKKDKNEILLINEYQEKIQELENKTAVLAEQLKEKSMILDMLIKAEAIIQYNLSYPKEERGVGYKTDFNDPLSMLADLKKFKRIDPSNYDKMEKLLKEKLSELENKKE